MKKILSKTKNKAKRMLRKLAAWTLAKLAKPMLEKFNWQTVRWTEDVCGLYVIYYVCKNLEDECRSCINAHKNETRYNGNQEALESSRHSVLSSTEEIQPQSHRTQEENRRYRNGKVQDQDHDIQHLHTSRCLSR